MALDVPAGRAVIVTSGETRSPLRARYLPIAEHGLIGDLHTVALVGTDGAALPPTSWGPEPALRRLAAPFRWHLSSTGPPP